jgi:hypothetical protein
VTLVIVGHGAGAPLLHRQARWCTVQRLDLPLFIDGQNYGMRRRIKRPAMSRTFAANGGSFESLNVRMRCG